MSKGATATPFTLNQVQEDELLRWSREKDLRGEDRKLPLILNVAPGEEVSPWRRCLFKMAMDGELFFGEPPRNPPHVPTNRR